MLLAIDTSTRVAGIAMYDHTGLQAEQLWRTGDNHTTELLPYIVTLCGQLDMTPESLTAIGVSLGPGSFTGLRVGLSVAKGLCLALRIPLLGVPALDATAYAHRREAIPVCATLPLGRGRLCFAMYGSVEGQWSRTSDYRLVPSDELPSLLTGPSLVCGEVDADLRQALVGTERAIVASPASAARRAGFLAEIAWDRLQSGQSDDPATLGPLYLQTL